MPVLTLNEVESLPDTIDGRSDFGVILSRSEANSMAQEAGYDTWEDAIDDDAPLTQLRYRYVIGF